MAARCVGRQRGVRRQRLTDRDQRGRFGQPVDVRHRPAEFAFDPADGRRRGRRAGGDDLNLPARASPHLVGRVGEADEDRRRRAERGDRLALDQFEDTRGCGLSQADVRAARRGHGPRERPAIGVKHGQRPEVPIRGPHRHVDEDADRVEPRVPVRDHHALRTRRRAAGVVDRQEVVFVDRGALERGRHARRSDGGELVLVRDPAVANVLERDEVLNRRKLGADSVDRCQTFGGHAHDLRAAVRDDVREIVGGEPVVDRHQDGPNLRHRIEGLELRVDVRRDVRHTVARRHAQALQHRRPAVAAIEELLVGEPQVAVDDGLPRAEQPASAASEL